jgi:hypothetical protein
MGAGCEDNAHIWLLLSGGDEFHKADLCSFTRLVKTAMQLHFYTGQVFS